MSSSAISGQSQSHHGLACNLQGRGHAGGPCRIRALCVVDFQSQTSDAAKCRGPSFFNMPAEQRGFRVCFTAIISCATPRLAGWGC